MGITRSAIGIGFFAATTAIILYGPEPFPYRLNQEIQGPIYARVNFGIPNEEATQQAKQDAREETPNYYYLNEGLIERLSGMIGNLFSVAKSYENFEAYQAAKAKAGENAAQDFQWQLSEEGFQELNSFIGEEGQGVFTKGIENLKQKLKRERLVKAGEDQNRPVPWKSKWAILKNALPNEGNKPTEETNEFVVNKLSLVYDSNIKNIQRSAAILSQTFPASIQDNVFQILMVSLKDQPLFKYDLDRTHSEMEKAAIDRSGEIFDTYAIYEVLAQASEDIRGQNVVYHLNGDQVEYLKYEHDKVAVLLTTPLDQITKEEERPIAHALQQQHRYKQVALGAMSLLIIIGMIAYCSMFQPRVIQNPVRALSIAILFLIMITLSRASYLSGWTLEYPYIVVGPVVMTSAILTMVYTQRFAIGMTASLALLITLAIRGDVGTLLVLGACLAVGVYQLREIRGRKEFFYTGVLNGLTAFIVAMIAWLLESHSLETALPQAWRAAAAALVSIAIFILVLSPVERIFKVATNWTLLELLDTSKPLLSRLAREAPGTFAHSLWLGSMAESACEVIGANGLLAKVGAMYHDIGKVHKAEYFAENQEANINRHDKLSPTMSLLIIIGHVKDGVELAKEESLPPAVIRFIEEHHGTTVVRYFHHVATEQQKAAGNTRGISETEFRYPGPKPQARETACLMLCDGVEGAVRALQEPTAGRIETVVHNVLMERLKDGQFDECDITLKELHQVEESLVKSLCRFYHGRIAYPKASTSEQTETVLSDKNETDTRESDL